MAGTAADWNSFPHHVLVKILSYLSRDDRIRASQTCRAWNDAFSSPELWRSFDFWFYMPNQSKSIECVNKFGKYLRNVYIELDQGVELNRRNACLVLNKLAKLEERSLGTLKISFTGENPCFYAGSEFVKTLHLLFGPSPEQCNAVGFLKDVDLSNLTVGFTGELIETLADNNPHVEKLNIQNGLLICKVHPRSVMKLVQKCRKLRDLRVYKCSVTKEVLEAVMEKYRQPMEHLSLIARFEEERIQDFGDDIWKRLSTALPFFRVTLKFESTCPQNKILQVMKPSVPIRELCFAPFSSITEEVRQATSYYSQTLENVVVQSQSLDSLPEFNEALIEMASECTKLTSLHISCPIEKCTIERILSLCPNLKQTNACTLRCEL